MNSMPAINLYWNLPENEALTWSFCVAKSSKETFHMSDFRTWTASVFVVAFLSV